MSAGYYTGTAGLSFVQTQEMDYVFDIDDSHFVGLGCGLHIKSIQVCYGNWFN